METWGGRGEGGGGGGGEDGPEPDGGRLGPSPAAQDKDIVALLLKNKLTKTHTTKIELLFIAPPPFLKLFLPLMLCKYTLVNYI
jgi:hypothetical protein